MGRSLGPWRLQGKGSGKTRNQRRTGMVERDGISGTGKRTEDERCGWGWGWVTMDERGAGS